MLKANKPFDPETDKKNQQNSQDQNAKQKENQESRSRRFQSADSNAPISGRYAKRRTGKGSQVALPQNAGSPVPAT